MKRIKVEFYRDSAREWRWRLFGANGRIIADCAEGYSTRRPCVKAFDRIVTNIQANMLTRTFNYDV